MDQVVANLITAAALIGVVVLARRNLRHQRGHRRAALRLALVAGAFMSAGRLLTMHHVPTSFEVAFVFGAVAWGLFQAALVWLCYVALEPYVRRLWPRVLVSWIRLLDGRIKDPLVARHLIYGAVAGIFFQLLDQASRLWVGEPIYAISASAFLPFGTDGGASFLGYALIAALSGIMPSVGYLALLLLFRLLLRNIAAAAILMVLLNPIQGPMTSGLELLPVLVFQTGESLWLAMIFRFGFLSAAAALVVSTLLERFPLTIDLSLWYAPTSLFVLAMVVVLAVAAFRVSLGGRALLSDLLKET
ncbi:MAG: hypothetical protein QF681_00325 [Vicinamibacterales bacterium]|nr:hypothetical protein [Vicinamibacterales bacterium]